MFRVVRWSVDPPSPPPFQINERVPNRGRSYFFGYEILEVEIPPPLFFPLALTRLYS